MPKDEFYECSKYGECMGSINYFVVLSTDLKTGKTVTINKYRQDILQSDPKYIKYNDNTILLYTVGLPVLNNDLSLYSYNIKENTFKKLNTIKNIGYECDVSAVLLKDGNILFTGGATIETYRDTNISSEYLPSVIYNVATNKIIKKTKMLYTNVAFHQKQLIPLKNGDILVLENGIFRQYFDFATKTFKPLQKTINIGKISDQKITVINEHKILISHGSVYTNKHQKKLNKSAYIIEY